MTKTPNLPPSGRRALLRAAVVAIGVTAAGDLLRPGQGSADTGNLQYGKSNDAGSSNTSLKSSGGFPEWTFYGNNTSDGKGIVGDSAGGWGVYGYSDPGGTGVFGDSPTGIGVDGYSESGTGVRGQSNTSAQPAIYGNNLGGGDGVVGLAAGADKSGVYGTNSGGGYAVFGASSGSVASVQGRNTGSGPGVVGEGFEGPGVRAVSHQGHGVDALTNDSDHAAVYANHPFGGEALFGQSHGNAPTVRGDNLGSGSGVAGNAESEAGAGVLGTHTGGGDGVRGTTNGSADGGAAVAGINTGGGYGVAGVTEGATAAGVRGQNNAGGDGVTGEASGRGVGVRGVARAAGNGVVGIATSPKGALVGQNAGTGDGVTARSRNGRGGSFAGKTAALRLIPSATADHPVDGKTGDLFLDRRRRLWFCKLGGTKAAWVQLA
jgi:hypothetical protein